ncbi:hypothetical protein V492_00105 [Pseudogymnoascus sp. VKM F-4246]|nr:hypothetical protein V492_00105 [Pseudogymnoascus sp. VKM F-4246]
MILSCEQYCQWRWDTASNLRKHAKCHLQKDSQFTIQAAGKGGRVHLSLRDSLINSQATFQIQNYGAVTLSSTEPVASQASTDQTIPTTIPHQELDRAAEARTLCTTDELYISAPYFTPEEAVLIKNTVVSPPILTDIPEFETLKLEKDIDSEASGPAKREVERMASTVEAAITSCLRNFFAKRRASGDARPCGPHDMGPIYKAVFGITTEELRDEKFLGRLRRTGLGQSKGETERDEGKRKRKKKGSNVD